jgi:hypothetical protein
MYVDSTGIVRVLLTDPQQAPIALAEVRAMVDTRRQFVGTSIGPAARYEVIVVSRSFADLLDVHTRTAQLRSDPDLTFADINEVRNRVILGFATAEGVARANAWLEAAGIPVAGVEVRLEEPTMQAADLRDKIRPLLAGTRTAYSLQFGGYTHCTLGFHAKDNLGRLVSLVNSHCTTVRGAVDGTTQYQSSLLAGHEFGTEIVDPSFVSGLSGCPVNRYCRYSDAALVLPLAGVTVNFPAIARTNSGSINLLSPAYTVVGRAFGQPFVGETLYKVGQLTGTSIGPVTETNVTVPVFNSNGTSTNLTLLGQARVQANVNGGDSGSPVFAPYCDPFSPCTYNAILYGILWGRNGTTNYTFSPLSNIEQDLGYTLIVK